MVSLERPPVCWLDPSIVRRVRAYVSKISDRIERGAGLWLGGDRGTGKTSAAAVIAKEASLRGHAVGFHPLSELLMRIRASFDERPVGDPYAEKEQNLIDQLSELDLLVIDDMGAVRATPWVMQQLYVIVNRRYNEQRATVITTDLDREDLAAVVGWRVVSRLVEMTGQPVIFSGPDHRLEPEAPALSGR